MGASTNALAAYDAIQRELDGFHRHTQVAMADAVLDEVRAASPVRGAAPTRRRPGRNRGQGGGFRDSWGVAAGGAEVVAGERAASALAGWDGREGVRVATTHPGGPLLARGWSLQAASGWIKRSVASAIGRARA